MPEELKVIMTGESGELVDAFRKSGASVKGFTDDVKKGSLETKTFKNTLTELRSGVELVEKVYRAVQQVYKETVQAAVDQAVVQKSLARQMGVTAAEAGRLMDVSDDLSVSQETLTFAFRALNEKGLQPNFETLVKLAREYQALPTSVAKNQFAADMFGKSGIEMQKILETNVTELKDMGQAALASGEILSGPAVASMEQFRKKLKEVGDGVEGLKTQVGVGLVEQYNLLFGFKAGPGPAGALATYLKFVNDLNAAEKAGLITRKESRDELIKVFNSSTSAADGLEWLKGKYDVLNIDVDKAGHWIKSHTTAVKADAKAVADYSTYLERQTRNTGSLNTQIQEQIRNLERYKDDLAKLKPAIDAVTAAQDNLATSRVNWMKGGGEDIAGYYRDLVGSGQQAIKGLERLDMDFGTQTALNLKKEILEKKAAWDLARGDLDAYRKDVSDFKLLGEEEDSVEKAKAKLGELKTVLDNIQKQIVIDIYIVEHYGALPTPAVKKKKKPGELEPLQHGGSVLSGKVYRVGEMEPEWFVSSSAGRIMTQRQFANYAGAGTTINMPMTVYGGNPGIVKGAAKNGLLAAMRAKGKK